MAKETKFNCFMDVPEGYLECENEKDRRRETWRAREESSQTVTLWTRRRCSFMSDLRLNTWSQSLLRQFTDRG